MTTDATTFTFTTATSGPLIAAVAYTNRKTWIARPDDAGHLVWRRALQRLPARHAQRVHMGRLHGR